MFNLLLVTPWNLMRERGGDHNRVLGLADAISKMANVIVLHQGPNRRINRTRFFHYDPVFKNKKCDSLAMTVINYYTSSIATSINKSIQNIALTEDIDIIQVEQSFPFFPAFKARNSLNKDIVLSLDNHNVHFPLPKLKLTNNFLYSLYRVMNSPYIKSMESFAVNKSDIVLSVSNKQAELLKELYNLENEKVHVVPNGVDVNSFEEASYPKEYKGFKNKVIFFHGTLSWYPNMEAIDIILDYIAPKIENSTFVICGPNPTLTFLKKVSKSKNVKYLGYVDQLPRYIKEADLCIAPLVSGGGTKLKLLEYAAAGKPIIATKKAVEGLPFTNKYNALLYDEIDNEFINGIKEIMSDEKLSEKIGRNARKLAQNYDWNKIAEKLFRFYKNILENNFASANVSLLGGG